MRGVAFVLVIRFRLSSLFFDFVFRFTVFVNFLPLSDDNSEPLSYILRKGASVVSRLGERLLVLEPNGDTHIVIVTLTEGTRLTFFFLIPLFFFVNLFSLFNMNSRARSCTGRATTGCTT